MGEITQNTWDNLIDILPPDISILTFDRPGIGQSARSPLPRDAENITSELRLLLDHLNFSKYILVGHSMGGLYARYLACKAPDMVSGLLLLDSTHEDQLVRGSQFYDPVMVEEGIKNAKGNPEGLVVPDDPERSFKQMGQFKSMPQNIRSVIVAAENSLPEQVPHSKELNNLNITLQKELSVTSPGAEFKIMKNSSHFIYIDQPEQTAELISSFLK